MVTGVHIAVTCATEDVQTWLAGRTGSSPRKGIPESGDYDGAIDRL